MKILPFLLLLIPVLVFSQNDLKARLEYEMAEEAFAEEAYPKAVTHLAEAEKLLGKWTPKVSYLFIICLDKVMDYQTPDSQELQTMNAQIKKYMQYASRAKNIDTDKFREIHTIEKYVNSANIKFEDPDAKLAAKYFNDKDYGQSFDYSKKAAEKGNLYTMTYIGYYYAEGKGVEKNLEQAQKWYTIPAERKIRTAMNNLGMLHYDAKKYSEAKKWFEKAAMKDDGNSICSLGVMYYSGLGVQQDYDQSLSWFEKALDKNFTPNFYSMHIIGHLYYMKQDYEKSMKWFKGSYENGDAETKNIAKGYIAKMYQEGLGTEKNKKLAREWRNK